MPRTRYGANLFESKKSIKRGVCWVKHCRNKCGTKKSICYKHDAIVWRTEHPVEAAYKMVHCSARKRQIKFNLTLDEFKKLIEGTGYIERKGRSTEALHIDRVDPRQGYFVENLQIITCEENLKRRDAVQKKITGFYRLMRGGKREEKEEWVGELDEDPF